KVSERAVVGPTRPAPPTGFAPGGSSSFRSLGRGCFATSRHFNPPVDWPLISFFPYQCNLLHSLSDSNNQRRESRNGSRNGPHPRLPAGPEVTAVSSAPSRTS